MNERDELVVRLRGWDHCWPAPWLEGAVQDAADQIERDGREIERLREALADAGRMLDWAARAMKGNCSGSDVNAVMLAAGKTADARAALNGDGET